MADSADAFRMPARMITEWIHVHPVIRCRKNRRKKHEEGNFGNKGWNDTDLR